MTKTAIKVGRNDPCPCGSGKKYKQCHLPIEEAARTAQRRLWQAQDTLMPKIIGAARDLPLSVAAAFQRYWNGAYSVDQLNELDEVENHGAERFLSWFAFDYVQDDGRTLVERLADDPSELDATADEQQLLHAWRSVRLRPYTINDIHKNQGFSATDLLDNSAHQVEDHTVSHYVEPDEVLIVHLLPVGTNYAIGGAAAHLTEDTREKLRAFAGLHLEAMQRDNPSATWDDLVRQHSEVLNHFVMGLPVEAPDPSKVEALLQQTRQALGLLHDEAEDHEADRTAAPGPSEAHDKGTSEAADQP